MTNDSASDLEAIAKVRQAHVAALNPGDPDALAACFAEDGIQMPPFFPASVGRDAIRSWAAALLTPFNAQFSLDVVELELADPWAFERGSYRFSLTPKGDGPTIQDSGKYITIYRRLADSRWAIARDIWNSDAPPAPPQTGSPSGASPS